MDQPNSRLSFDVESTEDGEGARFTVTASDGRTRHYHVDGGEHPHYLEFFAELAEDFGEDGVRTRAVKPPERKAEAELLPLSGRRTKGGR